MISDVGCLDGGSLPPVEEFSGSFPNEDGADWPGGSGQISFASPRFCGENPILDNNDVRYEFLRGGFGNGGAGFGGRGKFETVAQVSPLGNH